MVTKEELVLSIDDELKRVFTLALKKYQKEIEKNLIRQKSQMMIALFEVEKSLVQRALRKINPLNKDLLPTIVFTEQLKSKKSRNTN
jgi:hypothetical protein